MSAYKCKVCGEYTTREDNYYVCRVCDNKWEIEDIHNTTAIRLVTAWEALRESDFDKASALFEEIAVEDPKNHEALWGKALAQNGIVFVTDLNENKKVPTCNNITENSFISDKNVQKAISLAGPKMADSYKALSQKIEAIRIEWLEKARKEPPYDVFISFKDSDKEHNITRTQDSIDAQDLYNALIDEGYKVFFSRISLRDKVSEHYEPYIYNAIKTAKVMIVYGQRPEYFTSTWLKNEWSRFCARISKGEKHKNSLVVVYKNMDPNDLPVVLKSRQCMNASALTFLPDLTKHIAKIIDFSKQDERLTKIKIEGGKISKKATEITVNSIQKREIGGGAIAETSVDEKKQISVINSWLNSEQWKTANELIEDVLFNNPNCAEAIWCQILSNAKTKNDAALKEKINSFKDFALLEKLLNCATKEFASRILSFFYGTRANDATYSKILKTILPYNFDKRDACLKTAFETAINQKLCVSFDLLISTLNSNEVDRYIDYNHRFSQELADFETKQKYLNSILSVDAGNLPCLRALVEGLIREKKITAEQTLPYIESLLRYSSNGDKEIRDILKILNSTAASSKRHVLLETLLRYYSKNITDLASDISCLGFAELQEKMFDQATQSFNLLLSVNKNDADAYWGLCLAQIKATSEQDVKLKDQMIKDTAQFNKYLSLVDEKRRAVVIDLSTQQQNAYNDRLRKAKQRDLNSFDQSIAAIQTKKNEVIAVRSNLPKLRILAMLGIVLSFVLIICMINVFQKCAYLKDKVNNTAVIWEQAGGEVERKFFTKKLDVKDTFKDQILDYHESYSTPELNSIAEEGQITWSSWKTTKVIRWWLTVGTIIYTIVLYHYFATRYMDWDFDIDMGAYIGGLIFFPIMFIIFFFKAVRIMIKNSLLNRDIQSYSAQLYQLQQQKQERANRK